MALSGLEARLPGQRAQATSQNTALGNGPGGPCGTARAALLFGLHFPWDFLPSIDLGDPRDLGMTETLRIPQTRRERARGIKPPGTKFRVRGVCYASMDKPGAVDVFYSDYRCEESDADGTLLHELVHAMRI